MVMSDLEYRGWHIELQSNKVAGGEGWPAYVTVVAHIGGSVRTKPLSRSDGRVFPSKEAADQAGIELAKAWIDREG